MKSAGIIVLVLAGLTVYWMVTGKAGEVDSPLPDAGGPGTANKPVATGPTGVGTAGQPSTLNGPAPGSTLFNQLFPPGP